MEKLICRTESLSSQQGLESLQELEKLIKDDAVASDYVIKYWKCSKDMASNYLATKQLITEHISEEVYDVKYKLIHESTSSSRN